MLILMYMDPFTSLPLVLKIFTVVRQPVMVWWLCVCEGAFRCSLYLSPNVLADSSMYLFITINSIESGPVYFTIFVLYGSSSSGDMSMFLIILLPLKYALMPYLLYTSLTHLYRSCTYGMTMYPLYVLLFWVLLFSLLLLVLFGLFCWKVLYSIPYISHDKYLQLVRTSIICCFSILHSSGMEDTVLSLCVKVSITLHLAPMRLWLFKCKYWSVWVGFLFTLVVSVPLCSGMTNVPRNSIEPSALCLLLQIW